MVQTGVPTKKSAVKCYVGQKPTVVIEKTKYYLYIFEESCEIQWKPVKR